MNESKDSFEKRPWYLISEEELEKMIEDARGADAAYTETGLTEKEWAFRRQAGTNFEQDVQRDIDKLPETEGKP